MSNFGRIAKFSQQGIKFSRSLTTAAAVKPNRNPTTETQLFINNEFVPAKSGKTFETINPTNGKVIARIAAGDSADVDVAVEAANKAFKLGSPWRTSSGAYRAELMHKLANLIERDAAHLASLECIDNGKPYNIALNVDIPASVSCLRSLMKPNTVI